MKKLVPFLTLICLLFAFNFVHAQDAITNITAPDPVTAGATEVVTVTYTSTNDGDIVVSIQEFGGSWATYGSARVTVATGTGSVDVNLPVSASIPVAVDAYKIGAYLAPIGGGYGARLSENNVFNIDAIASSTPADALSNFSSPATVVQGQTITVNVDYIVGTVDRDIFVQIKPMSGSGSYGYKNTSFFGAGTSGTASIQLPIDAGIPVASNAYKIICFMTAVGGSWDAALPSTSRTNISAIAGNSVTGVNIDNCPSANLIKGNTHQMTATVAPADATNQTIAWSSSNETVATVDATGLVTAVDDGTATISVTTDDGGFTDNCLVNVIAAPVDNIISVTAPDPVTAGATEVVTVNYTAINNGDIVVNIQENGGTWANYGSARVSVASGTGSVDVNLPVSASIPVAVNAYKISAYLAPTGGAYPDKLAEKSVINIDAVAGIAISGVTGVSIDNCPSADIIKGNTHQMTATVAPADATNQTIAWSSSNETVATVNATGLVTAVDGGTATITVTTDDGSFNDNCLVNVIAALADNIISVTAPDPVTAGVTEVVTVNYTAINNGDIVVNLQENGGTWANYGSVRVSVASGAGSVDVNLPVSASIPVAVNAYKISAFLAPTGGAYPDRLAEKSVINIDAVASIAVTGVNIDNCPSADLTEGGTHQLTATVAPVGATNQVVSWSSSDETVATVDATGLVTAVAAGPATITVTTDDGGFTDNCLVNVIALVDNIISFTAPDQVSPGQVVTIQVNYEACTNRDIIINLVDNTTWTNYGSSRVTVAAGTGTQNIALTVLTSIPLATGTYNLTVGIAPVGGAWNTNLSNIQKNNLDAAPSSPAPSVPLSPWATLFSFILISLLYYYRTRKRVNA